MKRARNVGEFVELVVSFAMANSEFSWLLVMEAAAGVMFASELPNKRAPWMNLHFVVPDCLLMSAHFVRKFKRKSL